MYPLVARYKGHGSVDEASRFVCRKSFGPKARLTAPEPTSLETALQIRRTTQRRAEPGT